MKKIMLLASVALSACGGGGGGAQNVEPPVAPAPNKVVRIAMYGDSTMYGWTRDTPTGSAYQAARTEPSEVQRLFDQDLGAGRVIVTNHGVSGSTCPELLNGQAPITTPWASEMAASQDDIVVVNEGINDSFTSESDADFANCYAQLASIAKTFGKTLVIESPNPIDKPQNERIRQFVLIGQNAGAPYIPVWETITAKLPDWKTYLPDGVHPTVDLYVFKASVSYPVLRDLAVKF